MKHVMINMHRLCLYTYITSSRKLDYWVGLIPSLANVKVSHAPWAMKFPNLYELTIQQPFRDIPIEIICPFNFPLLQKLFIQQTMHNDMMPTIAVGCPQLRVLKVSLKVNWVHIVISDFPSLITFIVSCEKIPKDTNVYIHHMPSLTKLCIHDLEFNKLEIGFGVLLLDHIELLAASLRKLIFHDVATLTTLQLYDDDYPVIKYINPFKKVNWNLKNLSLPLAESNQFLFLQNLHSLKKLRLVVTPSSNNIAINWSAMTFLTELYMINITNAIVETIFTNVQILALSWSNPTIFDFHVLTKFANVKCLSLHGDQYTNFECLFELKQVCAENASIVVPVSVDNWNKMKQWLQR